ncbi:MAG TPA: ABC transporter substrate-binding protein [Plantibacter sp.]|uniref:ABC transporter substrate-binding protein n=1 Tax=unclassified Plantibacter TaxID=2624265 RepID=UPI002BCFDFD7|nr:ABC transporter substrate-binding protein [Plantibacter sp.]
MPRTAPSPRRRLIAGLALSVSAALALTGCSSASAGSSTGTAMRTVDSQFGEVAIPVDPHKALGFYTTDVDILVTLDIPLADSQPIRGEGYDGFPAFFPAEVDDVETFANFPDYNYEAVLNAQPDFILNGLGYDAEAVERLPAIAPTYSIDAFADPDWRVTFKTVAEALDRMDEHDAWTERYQARIDEVKAELAAAELSPVVAPIGEVDGEINVSCYGVPCLVFRDLGLTILPIADSHDGTTLSLEQLDQLSDLDVVFTTGTPEDVAAGSDPFAALAANTVWNQLPFIQNEQVFTHDLEMIYGSPSGQMAFLDVVEQALVPQH